MKKRIVYVFVIVGMIATLLLSFCVTAFSLSWDGSSSGGGGNGTSAGANGYAIMTTDDYCMVGYRFSVVDKSGNTKNGKVIDVFRNNNYANEAFNFEKFSVKRNKKQLKDSQNGSFTTKKTTTNCYKEKDMNFAKALPVTSGMKSWQNDMRNLNPVLSKLGINGISELKKGDKVLVEPIYDVRLESVWHSITVTEIALYGKHILGAKSNGGSSPNSESWGFIAAYTNMHFPNSLYTPDGQGLWTSAKKLTSQATFYTIINTGYGVGIAYTETKEDFTPSLSVYCCQAWQGNLGIKDTDNCYGTSYGNTFTHWSYKNGYPITDSTIWYSVNFPSESENCYVKQTVWIDGGNAIYRTGWSNSNNWFDVRISPTVIENDRSYITVKARVDWIDNNENTLKYGVEKSFYIPIKPIVTRDSISAYSISGSLQASANASGTSGAMYFGQKVYFKFKYGSKNDWTSSNHLRGESLRWSGTAWERINSDTDIEEVYINSARLSNTSSYTANSTIGGYVIPLNANEYSNSYKMRFRLKTYWASDTKHTEEISYYYLNIVKPDVELVDIKLVNNIGQYVDIKKLEVAEKLTVRHVYKNNTNCTIYVKGYKDDKSQISGTFSIPAGKSIEVNAYSLTVPNKRAFTIWGGVYLDTVARGNTDYESNKNNNTKTIICNTNHPVTITPITPNAPYREQTKVFSSFYIKNRSNDDYIPSSNLKVKFEVYQSSTDTLVYSETKKVLVPAKDSNLVYFSWDVPFGLKGQNVQVFTSIIDGTKEYNKISRNRATMTFVFYNTPETRYEREEPRGFKVVETPKPKKAYTTWWEYKYENYMFMRIEYGIGILDGFRQEAKPMIPSQGNDKTMKSGYGLSIMDCRIMTSVENYDVPKENTHYTVPQYAYSMFPEFGYANISGSIATMKIKTENRYNYWIFPKVGGVDNVHYTPIWYPDGPYEVVVVQSDSWTPMGMLSCKDVIGNIEISGNMYDDWYVKSK